MLPGEVLRDDLRYRTNPATPYRMGQHIDHRSRRVGDINPLAASPHRHQTEVLRWIERVEYECRTTDRRGPVSGTLTGHDQNVPEDLLGKIPMLSGTPPGDVRRFKNHLCDDPRILMRFPGPMRVQRNGEVQAATHSIEPPPISQVSDETSSPCQADVERSRRI